MSNSREVETDKIMGLLREEAQYIIKSPNIPEAEKHYIMV